MEQRRKKLMKDYALDRKENPTKEQLKKQRDYAFSSNGLAYRSHVYCVFTDFDFQSDIAKLRKEIESLYYPNISLETSYYDEHILQEDRILIKEIADRYRITLEDLGFFADGYFSLGYAGFGKNILFEGGFKILHPMETESLPVYAIGKYTTLEDIRREWQYIKEMTAVRQFREPDESARKRSPDNPTLIYSIFKARSLSKSFKNIFELYEQGKLPGYRGSCNQFSNEESLERYYRKYAPKPVYNDIDSERNLTYIDEIKM